MRAIVMIILFAASLAFARDGYEEVRDLRLDGRGIDTLSIDAGAGSLSVRGVAGMAAIEVTATIQVDEDDADRARQIIESDLVLSLERDSDVAVLKSYFDERFWNFGNSPAIQLEVRVPAGMHLRVDDGSGPIDIENLRGDIRVEDGSGSISMSGVGGTVDIEDGSGYIEISGVGADLRIEDGSGRIEVRDVAGSVVIDDGSGGIDVSDVEGDLTIVNDGSGGLEFSNIRGKVEKDG